MGNHGMNDDNKSTTHTRLTVIEETCQSRYVEDLAKTELAMAGDLLSTVLE